MRPESSRKGSILLHPALQSAGYFEWSIYCCVDLPLTMNKTTDKGANFNVLLIAKELQCASPWQGTS